MSDADESNNEEPPEKTLALAQPLKKGSNILRKKASAPPRKKALPVLSNKNFVLRDYAMVRFTHSGRKRKVEDVDFVPVDWVLPGEKKGTHVCKFLASMEDPEKVKMLHQLVKNKIEAPEAWPTFPVEVLGHAKTYEDGLKKIKVLQKEPNAFTSDSEMDSNENRVQVINAIRQRHLQKQAKKLLDSFQSSDLSTQEGPSDEVHDGPVTGSNVEKVQKNEQNMNKRGTLSTIEQNKIMKESEMSESSHVLDLSSQSTLSEACEKPVARTSTLLNNRGSSLDKENDTQECQQKSETELLNCALSRPVLDLSNVSCESEFELSVILRLDRLEKNQESMLKNQELILKNQKISNTLVSRALKSLKERSDPIDFEEKHRIQLPFATLDAFLKFNDSLVTNELLKNDTNEEFGRLLDKDLSISRSFSKIMRRFMSKDVVNNFTALRESKDDKQIKQIFSNLQFCKLMFGLVKSKREAKFNSETEDRELRAGLTDVFGNKNKWT